MLWLIPVAVAAAGAAYAHHKGLFKKTADKVAGVAPPQVSSNAARQEIQAHMQAALTQMSAAIVRRDMATANTFRQQAESYRQQLANLPP